MDISFRSAAIEALCNDRGLAKRKLGLPCAKKLAVRLDDLDAAGNLSVMIGLPGNCHELKGNRAGQLSIELHGGVRLIFVPNHELVPRKPDGGLDWKGVTAIQILEVTDYHD